MTAAAEDVVTGALQSVYGDAVVLPIDRQAARAVVDALRFAGWVDLETVAVLIAAAGGRIDVPDRVVADPPEVIERYGADPARGIAYSVRVR